LTPDCDKYQSHTYYFGKTYTVNSIMITTRYGTYNSNFMPNYLDFRIDGIWTRKREFNTTPSSDQTNNFDFEPFEADAFRISTSSIGRYHYTRGILIVDENGTPEPPPEQGFPWIWVAIAVIGVISAIAVIKKK